MAKKGMHKHDSNDQRIARGHNNHEKSTEITTGTPKKRSTYRKQALAHEDPGKQAQDKKNRWTEDTRLTPTHRLRVSKKDLVGEERSGSDSNSDSGVRGY
ncbi:MAG TPA: hypothetical protein VFX31_03240 [Ktedonobacterales bacterium]|jgi:hypothetical protein|nr:hypothetical protein [Ktedonobacterales bacterium]HEX5570373.1 hypothetical protein [Ktedonobacterales bacterium]